MDIETITKLIDAGFTKEDITAFMAGKGPDEAGAGDQQDAGKNNPPTDEKPGNDGSENAGKVEAPDPLEAIKALTATVNGLNETVKAMQAANVKNATTATTSKGDPILTAMESFISTL